MKTAVFTAFDEGYFFYSAVMVRTFSDNYHGKEPIDFFCMVPEHLLVEEEHYKEFVGPTDNLNLKFVCAPEFKGFIEEFNGSVDYVSSSVWHRIYMGTLFKDYDRAIHIDPDTLITRGVKPLLEFPEYGKFMAVVEAAVSDNVDPKFLDTPYFNCGVFIADLNYWREAKIADKVLDYLRTYGVPALVDQDILNPLLWDVLYPLPMEFNLFCGWTFHLGNFYSNPVIVHFIGPNKPWHSHKYDGDKWTKLWRNRYNELLDNYNTKHEIGQ
jgi:lipopolysaccharide biosynthesis glycosyltransferase